MADSIGTGTSASLSLGTLSSKSGDLVASVSDTFSQQASFEGALSSLFNDVSTSFESNSLDRLSVSEAIKKSEATREDISNAIL